MDNRRTMKIFFLLLLLGYILFTFGQACYRNAVQTTRLREKEKQVAIEEKRNETLKKRIEELGTDEGIEQEARQKLGMTAPGEIGYRVLTKEEKRGATAVPASEKEIVTQDSGSGKDKSESETAKPSVKR
jgi:cell division protein DivIC